MEEDYANGGLLDYLKWGSGTATGVLSALNQKAAPAATPAKSNVGLIVGIAAAVVVVLVLVVSLGRK